MPKYSSYLIFDIKYYQLNAGLNNLIKQAATSSSGFPTALTAGANGYIVLSINIPNMKYILSVRPHTANISDLYGLQLTPVYINPTKELIINYYAPRAVSLDALSKIRWIITWTDE